MAKDYWPELYSDPYAVKRIEKSVTLANILPGMSVLDVGCHMGELETYMPVEAMYTGIDHLNGHEIDGGFNLHQQFDRILCLETLEHLQWPRKTLASIVEHLKDDGIAVISLPNEATLFHRIRSFLGTPDQEAFSECGKHLHLPNMSQSLTFVSSHLKVLRVTPYFSLNLNNSRPSMLNTIGKLIPSKLLSLLSEIFPSLFARGFIFVCSKKQLE
jgi:hypothetical protein